MNKRKPSLSLRALSHAVIFILICATPLPHFANPNIQINQPIRIEVVWIDWKDPKTKRTSPKGAQPRNLELEKLLFTAVYQAFEKNGYQLDQSSSILVRVVAEGITKTRRYKESGTGRAMQLPVEYSGKYRVLIFNGDKEPKKFIDRFSFAPRIQVGPASSTGSKAQMALLVHDWLVDRLSRRKFTRHLE